MGGISFNEAKNKKDSFGKGIDLIDQIVRLTLAFSNKTPNDSDSRTIKANDKKASPVIVKPSATVGRNRSNDNVIPMETVTIQSFRREKSAEVENPIIHIGPAADEFARSNNNKSYLL